MNSISAYTLHNWVGKARAERGIEAPAPDPADDDGQKKVRQQEKRIRELEMEVAFLKKRRRTSRRIRSSGKV